MHVFMKKINLFNEIKFFMKKLLKSKYLIKTTLIPTLGLHLRGKRINQSTRTPTRASHRSDEQE